MSTKQMRIRGPKGTTKDSRIVVHVTGNPKTLDDPTHGFWRLYSEFGSMGEFIKELNRIGHRHKALKMMTSDARRGYISLEGYDKNRVPFDTPKSPELQKLLEKHPMPAEKPSLLAEAFNKFEAALGPALAGDVVLPDCTEGGAVAPVAP